MHFDYAKISQQLQIVNLGIESSHLLD